MDFAPASFSADDVLQVLEEQLTLQGSDFGFLEEFARRGDARLTVFRSRDGLWWVLCIETAVYEDRMGEHFLNVWLHGNCLRPRFNGEADLERLLFIVPEDVPFPEEHSSYSNIPRHQFSVLRHGKRETFQPSEQQYECAGLSLSHDEGQSESITPEEMLRFLCAHYGDAFFASEDLLRDLIDKRHKALAWNAEGRRYGFAGQESEVPSVLSHELGLFLQTHSWTHPTWEWNAEIQESRPKMEALGILAEAIVSGDLTAWNAQNPSVFNSHWRFWAERAADQEEAFEAAIAALDAQVQVLAHPAQDAFMKDARAYYGGGPKQRKGVTYKVNGGFALEAIVWQRDEHLIPTDPNVLREWLRRRANRSSSES